jgi:hypothetical protein
MTSRAITWPGRMAGQDERWRYSPGALSEAVGREVTFTGTDILRIADGKLAGYQAGVAGRCLGCRSLGMWICLPEAGQGPPQLSA